MLPVTWTSGLLARGPTILAHMTSAGDALNSLCCRYSNAIITVQSNLFCSIYDGDQVTNDQVNVPTVQPSQEKESKTQELAQAIKDIMAAQNPAQQPGFVSLITQA